MSFLKKLLKPVGKILKPIASFIPGGPLLTGALSAGASILGSKKQAGAAKNAAALQQQQYAATNAQQQPFIQGGYGAQTKLNSLLGTGANDGSADYGSLAKPFSVQDFLANKDPGYDFQLQQGNQALQNSAAAGSGALSGAALKDLLKYNQDYAGTAYQSAFERQQTQQGNIFSRLSGLLNVGQNAASNVGAQGTALAGNAGQAISNAGAATGAGIVGAGNAVTDATSLNWLLKNPDLLKRFMSQPQPVS